MNEAESIVSDSILQKLVKAVESDLTADRQTPSEVIVPASSLCWRCHSPAKYKCPGCSLSSCSLPCVKLHKIEKDCNGQRKRTTFVSLKDFTDSQLLSDFKFLEEIRSLPEKSKRTYLRKGSLSRRGSILKKACVKRKIFLSFAPLNFSFRKKNPSFFDIQKNCIFWKVSFKFIKLKRQLHLTNVAETAMFQEVLFGGFETWIGTAEDESDKETLKLYRSAGLHNLTVFLESRPARIKISAESEMTLRHLLCGKQIIEHPVFLVCLKTECEDYESLCLLEDVEKSSSSSASKSSSCSEYADI